jgi:hypothetical protein
MVEGPSNYSSLNNTTLLWSMDYSTVQTALTGAVRRSKRLPLLIRGGGGVQSATKSKNSKLKKGWNPDISAPEKFYIKYYIRNWSRFPEICFGSTAL